MKRISVNGVFKWEGRHIAPTNLREKLDHELTMLKEKKVYEISVPDLAFKYNTTRTRIGHLLAERDDVRRKQTHNALWEFI